IGLAFLLTVGAAVCLSLSWGAASARGDEKTDAELLKPFQGTWASSGEGIDATWTFDGDKIKASVAGMEYTCKAKIDKDAKPHASIDLTVVDGPEEAKGKLSKGIYKLDGEKLTLCVALPGKEDRPKDFAQVDDEAYLFELKKEKKKD
ncbi:MAG TPA: TIGR03067 domain-containing protein, partial [Planctomycetaceae bacterium]|nr:TIGR03067 domain-containing protein [Planctomycetaceae bacterium]